MAVYDDKGVYLRLPLVVTDLNASTPSVQTKLNAHAVAEFIALAQQYHLLCPSPLAPSGNTSARNAGNPSSMN
jgi:hypothetical protein